MDQLLITTGLGEVVLRPSIPRHDSTRSLCGGGGDLPTPRIFTSHTLHHIGKYKTKTKAPVSRTSAKCTLSLAGQMEMTSKGGHRSQHMDGHFKK